MKNINIVGTIDKNEISFSYRPTECKLENPRYFLVKKAIVGNTYNAYVYAVGIRNNGSEQNPAKFEAIECFDLFNQWRLTSNDSSYFSNNEFLELV
jgi:hypothetical protein